MDNFPVKWIGKNVIAYRRLY